MATSVEVRIMDGEPGSFEPVAYAPGAPMRIEVTVRTDEPLTCEGIDLVLVADGSGSGFSFGREGRRERLFSGALAAGVHTYTRTLPAPELPPTYEGDHMTLTWWAVVTADIPWAADPHDRERFVLLAPTDAALELELPPPDRLDDVEHTARAKEGERRTSTRIGIGCVALGLLAGVAAILLGVVWQQPEDVWGPFAAAGVLAAIVTVFLGGSALFSGSESDEAPIDVAVALHRGAADSGFRAADRGDALTCVISTRPDRRVEWVKARLEVLEWLEWRESSSSGNRRLRSASSVKFARTEDAQPTGAPGEWRSTLPLHDAPQLYSMEDGGGHGLIWQVEILLEHSGGKKPPERILRRLTARARG